MMYSKKCVRKALLKVDCLSDGLGLKYRGRKQVTVSSTLKLSLLRLAAFRILLGIDIVSFQNERISTAKSTKVCEVVACPALAVPTSSFTALVTELSLVCLNLRHTFPVLAEQFGRSEFVLEIAGLSRSRLRMELSLRYRSHEAQVRR